MRGMKRKGGPSRGGGGGGGRGGGGGGGGGGGRGGGGGGRGRGRGKRGGRGDFGRGSRGNNNAASKRGRHHTHTPDFVPPADLKPMKPVENGTDCDDEEYEEPPSAYTSLLHTLQATSQSFAKVYAQRQKEEQGDSESSEEEAGSYLEAEVDSDLEDDLDEESEAADDDVETGDEMDDQANGLEGKNSDGNSSSEESEWEEVDGDGDVGEEVPENEKIETDSDSDSERLSSGASAGTCTDPFKLHMELELTEEQIATLVEGKAKFTTEVAAEDLPNSQWLTNMPNFPKVERELSKCGLKERLYKHWLENTDHKLFGDFQSEGQAQFFSLCNSYKDILLTSRCGPENIVSSSQEHQLFMKAYVLHLLNHILKTTDLVTRNNEKLHRQQSNEDGKKSNDFIDLPRDQGFTRPKVLILLPLRSTAEKFVKSLIELAPKAQAVDVEHKSRFFDDFGAEEDEDDDDKAEDVPDTDVEYKGGKPKDFSDLFRGNNDDHFRIGIKFTRKSIKLYSEFYSSDIIIASPVGLVTRIGEAESAKKEDKLDIDFLSSIEIVVVDYVDCILMQNWKHVMTVFDHLNRIPTQQHGTDFMRIREWHLNGHSRHYRQTILLSTFADAGVNALFHRSCVNHAGKVKLRSVYPGVLSKVVLQVRQIYEKIDCQGTMDADDARFELFTKQVYPRIKDSLQVCTFFGCGTYPIWGDEGGILIFIRSYFDFVRLRGFLKSQNSSFCLLSEYTKPADVSRSRSWFFHQKRRIMLYTERAHYFHRYKIRGIRELIFYSLPEHPQFYAEVSNVLEGVENPTSTVLFNKTDMLQLERIVGTSRARRMRSSENKTFMFC